MAEEIKLQDLGEGIDSADVLEILVSVGDEVGPDDGIIELETDKATAVVPAGQAGKVTKIHVNEGDTIPAGAVLISLESTDAGDGQTAGEEESSEQATTAAADDESAQPAAVDSGPAADSGPPPATDPTTRSPNGNQNRRADRDEPADEPARAAAATESASTGAATAATPTSGTTPAGTTPETRRSGADIPAGPAMRRFARELGVDLGRVEGSGPGGRIQRADILAVVRDGSAPRTAAQPATGSNAQEGGGQVRVEKLSRIRRTIARQMHESWSTVPRVTNFDDADVTDLEGIRKTSKEDYAARGIKLTSMPFVIKSVAMALKNHPIINASLAPDGEQVIYHDYVNIGIAVDTERGLIVPNMRNAAELSIPEIARQLSKMADKVRNNEFSVEDLKGGTFTISNLGAIGGTYSTPIINVPETAILLIGRSRQLPVVHRDEIVPRLMMPLSISYDHRLIDGAAAARFLNDVIGYLEAPSRLLLAP